MFGIVYILCLSHLVFAQVDLQTVANGEFKRIDANNDGSIEKEEIGQFFKAYDTNHDNRLTRHEYDSAVDHMHPHDPVTAHILTALFEVLDSNNDNHLDDADYDKFFTSADTDKNSLVSSQEFLGWFHGSAGLPITG